MKGSLTRTLSIFLMLSILMLLLAVGVCYWAACMDAAAQAASHARAVLDDTAQAIAGELTDVMDSARMLSNENALYRFIKSDVSGRFEQKEPLQSLLKSFTDFKPLVIRMHLFIRDKSALLSGAQEVDVYSPLLYKLFVSVKDDYQLMTPYRADVLTRCYRREDGRINFAILTPVYPPMAAPRPADYLGSLVSLCDVERIAALMPESSQRGMLLCEGDTVLCSNDASFTLDQARGHGAISAAVPNTQWTLYTMAEPVNLGSQLRGVRTVGTVACAVAILAQALLLLALRSALVKPIIHIAEQTDAIADDSLQVQNPSRERNELARLTSGINGMLFRVRHLSQQMLDTRLMLYKERVMFLQAQMNPHFLYNNLACIRGMAGAGNAKAVRAMASDMAAIYRYCAQSSPVATLREEIACVKLYEGIYALRQEGLGFTLDFQAPEETLDMTTPRMFLQPLVENAFRHGYGAARRGTVRIEAACQGDVLTVLVIDHGAGMARSMLEELSLAMPDDEKALTGHLGLMNVWRRIQIIFGTGGGMRFGETPGGGLTVAVTLPQGEVRYSEKQIN